MIILEGGDNVGKSTLLRQLLELDPSLRVLKRDRFKPNAGETIATSYLNALMPPPDGDRRVHANSVADRFFASECIYGKLFRDGCRMTAREHFTIKTILLSYNAFVVHCDPPDHAIVKTWTEREQLYDRDPLLIANAYRRQIRTVFHPLPVIRYDWTSPNAAEVRERIIGRHHIALAQYELPLSWRVTTCTPEVIP